MSTQVVKAIEDIPDLVAKEVTRAKSRKKIDVKDVVDALLGSPRLISQIDMTMIEHEEVLKTLALFSKRKVKIYSSQAMGNATDTVGFGKHPTSQHPNFGKPRDYEDPEDPHPVLPSLKTRSAKEEAKEHALGNADPTSRDTPTIKKTA